MMSAPGKICNLDGSDSSTFGCSFGTTFLHSLRGSGLANVIIAPYKDPSHTFISSFI